jgi:DNA-binding transcriptional LysR family regulator
LDRLQGMAVFVKVVERGSFAAAAGDFRISGTMVGQHVRSLEHWLGGALLHRTTRRQSLTELGRQAYERFCLILRDLEDVEALGSLATGKARGLLRVMSTVSFGVHGLAPVLKDFRERHPQVDIDLVLSDHKLDMVNDGFDVLIRVGELSDSTMKARALAPYRSILCAAPQYLARHGCPKAPADLSSHSCLGFANPVPAQRWRLTGAEGEHVIPVSLALRANNGEALRVAALSGLGVIMQPEILLIRDLNEGRLVPVLENYVSDVRPVHVLFHPDRIPTPKVRTFVDFLVEKFARSLNPMFGG